MELKEWEIWYTYSTYLESTVIDLDTAARLLVDSGIALCALHRDGGVFNLRRLMLFHDMSWIVCVDAEVMSQTMSHFLYALVRDEDGPRPLRLNPLLINPRQASN